MTFTLVLNTYLYITVHYTRYYLHGKKGHTRWRKLYIFYILNILPEPNKCVFLFADIVLVVVKADIVVSLTLLRLCYDITLLYYECFLFRL